MKFSIYCVPMLLLCVLLANEVKQTNSGDVGSVVKDTYLEAIPLIAGIASVALTGPVAAAVLGGLACLQLVSKILTDDEEDNLSKKDFLESQAIIADAIKNVDTHVLKSKIKLTHTIESYAILEDMRNDLDTLREAFAHNMKVILNPKITGITKQTRMDAMLNYYSDFRQILRSFVSKYIKTKGRVSAQGPVRLFFDFILNLERIEIDDGDDCHLESTHTKLFKSFLYILKTLTDAYAMAVSAHTVQYQIELKNGNDSDNAIETQKFGLELLNDYKMDMKTFMKKAKWALDSSSREIRNCGTFELKRGETFESLSFAHMLPQIKNAINTMPGMYCHAHDLDKRFSDYEIDGKCTHGGLNKFTSVEIFTNSTNPNWPYLYLLSYQTWGSKHYYGHIKTGPGIVTQNVRFTPFCHALFCPAFKKNAIAISTQIVRADPEYVITGLRFSIRKNIVYMDIQQGKFVNDISVDPKTLTWTETPESNNILYLNKEIRRLELGDVEVKENEFLTAIQLKLGNEADGVIRLYVGGGSKASNWTTSALTGSSYLDKSNELVLSERDNPEQYGAGVKNMISKVPSKPSYFSFTPTGLKTDFGTTTIPYLDLRKVFSDPPAPLRGFGICHQAVKDSGGYASIKLISPDFSRFVDYKMIEAIKTTTET